MPPVPVRARTALSAALALLLACVFGLTDTAQATAATTHHVVAYYQTQYVTNSDGSRTYVSPLPLGGIATDVEVAAFHLNSNSTITLNDDPPSAATYDPMWSDLAAMQTHGTHVEAMLGGAAQGSYADLHDNFNEYYGLLRSTLRTYHFNGIDLDIEETFSLADTEHLIKQLRTDFGSGFIITLAPVATDLAGTSDYSGGFDYATLERQEGSRINWYNAQFYCGWGDLSDTSAYDSVVANGFSPSRVVAGTVTNPAACSGYVQPSLLASTIGSLVKEHPNLAGVAGWEYFNAVGPDGGAPATWYRAVRNALN